MTEAPSMTELPQHMTALARANATRKARGQLRHRVHDIHDLRLSRCELADVLAEGVPACMGTMRIEEALRWVFRHSDAFIDETLDLVGCSEFKPMGDLSVRQRSILVNVLRDTDSFRWAA